MSYIDATLGWDFDSYDALKGAFEQYMPNWSPPARSYATGVLANETSALVHMTDTPELFGGELRILAAIDFAEGKIARWVAYLGRILDDVPYGRSSRLRHVVGGIDGGGFEWTAGPGANSLTGIRRSNSTARD